MRDMEACRFKSRGDAHNWVIDLLGPRPTGGEVDVLTSDWPTFNYDVPALHEAMIAAAWRGSICEMNFQMCPLAELAVPDLNYALWLPHAQVLTFTWPGSTQSQTCVSGLKGSKARHALSFTRMQSFPTLRRSIGRSSSESTRCARGSRNRKSPRPQPRLCT
jgi:hypothetical protein